MLTFNAYNTENWFELRVDTKHVFKCIFWLFFYSFPFLSLLFFCLSGDDSSITIGEGVSIGDRVMVHCSGGHGNGEKPTVIGDRVVVGAGAILHGCTIETESFVGAGAQILDGAVVQKHAALAPGSLLAMNKGTGLNSFIH